MTAAPARWRPWASLSGRVALGAVGGLLVASILFAAIAVSLIRGEATGQARAELDRQARAIGALVSRSAQAALETGREFRAEPIRNLEQITGAGTRFYYVGLALSPGAKNPTGGLPETVARDLDPELLTREGSQGFGFMPPGAPSPTFAAAAPVTVGSRYIGAIVLTRPQQKVAASWGEVLPPVLVAAGLGLVVAMILVLWITRRATRPLRDLERAAALVAGGALDTEVATGGAEELDAVAHSFNAMVRQLARRDRLARDFLMRVTHDLRTPLTAIRGHASALVDGVVPEQAVPRSLGAISSEAQRLEVLVTDLLDLARMDADRFRVNAVVAAGDEPLIQAFDAMSSAADAAGLTFTSDIPELPEIVTDPSRVHQIVANLLDNAIRWTPAGGTVTLRARPRPGGGLVAEITDTGPGVPLAMRDQVFEPFRSEATPSGHQGSGLGLAIARQLARALGGDLTADEAPQGGARFTLLLPAEAPEEQDGTAHDGDPPPDSSGGSPGPSSPPAG